MGALFHDRRPYLQPDGSEVTAVTDADFIVLHRVRIRGTMTRESLIVLPGPEDGAAIDRLIAAGLLMAVGDRVALTGPGREKHLSLLRASLEEDAVRVLDDLYDKRFLPLNAEFKVLCTAWQESERLDLIEQLDDVHERLMRFLQETTILAPHVDGYRRRFEAAMSRFLDGEKSALADPLGDSYHNVWFELHEDLIVTLGRNRADEES